jgi:HrpA-like RNA helicase
MDLNESCEELLGRCPDPPVRGNVRTAQNILTQMQALDPKFQKITPLGANSRAFNFVYLL